MRVDEGERSARQFSGLVLRNILDLCGDRLGNIAGPFFLGIDRDDPERPVILATEQVPDDRCGVRLGRVCLHISKTRSAEVAQDQMQIEVEGRNRRHTGHATTH
jgi:hypothetical protein